MEDCIFCKIAAGEIPAKVIYEDDVVMAFEDANPLMPVHTLIVPKQHFSCIGDNIPDDIMGHLFNTVPKVAKIQGIDEAGYRTIVNTGEDGRQSVMHVHVHVLGGKRMNIDSPEER